MNRRSQILALFFVLALTGAGESRGQISALIKIGLSGSTLSGDTPTDFSAITRFAGGAGLSYDLGNGLLIQPEFLYIIKGATGKGSIDIVPIENPVPIQATFELTYLEVPVLLIYRFERRGLSPRIFAGPTLSFKLDSQVTFSALDGGPEFQERDDTVESSDLGITVGLGFDTEMGDELFTVGLRGTYGLSNARTGDPALHNTAFGVYAGFVF